MPVARRLKPETRKRLLAAAGDLFVSVGYLDATVAQICSRAGVSNGSFFHLFKTKAQLAEALVEGIARSYREEVLSRLLLPTRSPEQAIGAVLNAHLRWIAGDGTRARLWFGLRPALLQRGGDRSDSLRTGDIVYAVGKWAQPLVAAGEIRSIPIEVIAGHIFGGVDAIGSLQAGAGAGAGAGAAACGAEAAEADLARGMATVAWGAIRVRTRVSQRATGQTIPALDL